MEKHTEQNWGAFTHCKSRLFLDSAHHRMKSLELERPIKNSALWQRSSEGEFPPRSDGLNRTAIKLREVGQWGQGGWQQIKEIKQA